MSILVSCSSAETVGASTVTVAAIVSEVSPQFRPEHAVSAPPPKPPQIEATQVHPAVYVPIKAEMKWSHSKEAKFSQLAALKALGKATDEQIKELSVLRDLRRKKKNPQSAAEIVFQYRRREIEQRLLQDVRQYFAFLETASRS